MQSLTPQGRIVQTEGLEEDLIAVCDKHGISQSVVVFRNGDQLCIRSIADNPVDCAGASALGDLIGKALPQWQEAICAAMDRAAEQMLAVSGDLSLEQAARLAGEALVGNVIDKMAKE